MNIYSNQSAQHKDSHTVASIYYAAPKWHSELHICYLGQRERELSIPCSQNRALLSLLNSAIH